MRGWMLQGSTPSAEGCLVCFALDLSTSRASRRALHNLLPLRGLMAWVILESEVVTLAPPAEAEALTPGSPPVLAASIQRSSRALQYMMLASARAVGLSCNVVSYGAHAMAEAKARRRALREAMAEQARGEEAPPLRLASSRPEPSSERQAAALQGQRRPQGQRAARQRAARQRRRQPAPPALSEEPATGCSIASVPSCTNNDVGWGWSWGSLSVGGGARRDDGCPASRRVLLCRGEERRWSRDAGLP